jgi:ribosomal protein S18 acetylase RimI-like enzyme
MPPRQSSARNSKLLRQCLEFEYGLERDAAELVEPIDGGFAVLNPSAPLLWDASYLVIESPERSAEELAQIADYALGRHGFTHRTIDPIDPAEAQRLEPQFRRLRWQTERGVYMIHRRPPDRLPDCDVEEVAPEETYELRREVMKEAFAADYKGDREEIADQLMDHDMAIAEAAGDRWFIARHEAEPAACCSLLAHDGAGQVETVLTAPAARNRGLARAVVLAAVEASHRDGNELTFLGADADDWPWQLYQRFGFNPVGVALSFFQG